MKMTKLFAATFVAAAMVASCSKVNDNPKPGDGQETYSGVSVTLPAAITTRAEDQTAGSDGEKKINTVGIYVVDVETGRFDGKVFGLADFNPGTDGNNRQVLTLKTAIKTVTGDKKLFVIANPSTTATATSNLRTKVEAMRATTLNATPVGLPVSDFIVAASGKVTQMAMTGGVTTAFPLPLQTSTEAIAAANVKTVILERNLAKVVLRKSATHSVVGGTTTLSWVLRGEAKDATMIGQGTGKSLYAVVPADAMGTPTHDYWRNFSSIKTANIPAADYIAVNENADNSAGKKADFAASKYCFENYTDDDAARYHGNTTTAVIKGEFVPAEVVSGYAGGVRTLGSASDLNIDKTFWRYKLDNTYWNQSAMNALIAEDATQTVNFDEYTGGVGYYTVYVQDATGVVGAKRNSYYLIDIDEVRGPGRSKIDPDDPNDPTNPNNPIAKDTYISVTVNVKHWDFQNFVTSIE